MPKVTIMLDKIHLEIKLKELGMTKISLAKKLGMTNSTLHSMIKDPGKWKQEEYNIMARIGIINSITINT